MGNGSARQSGVPGCRSVLLAAPSGFCAGVSRAVETVERALTRYGAPVYVRRQIVHNRQVVERLQHAGAVFVAEVDEVPAGAVLVLSAHGVAPGVREAAADRGLRVIDATCPLVTKVHREARRYAELGYDILLIGTPDHDEVIGTAGVAPGRTHIVDGLEAARVLEVADPGRLVWLAQTTLTVDETERVAAELRKRFPGLQDPPSDDICYAAQNRQAGAKLLAGASDVVLVVGSANSHNSCRLVDVARACGTPAHLVDDPAAIEDGWLHGAAVVGVTAGASAPAESIGAVIAELAARGYRDVRTVEVAREGQHFSLPRELAASRP
ncbi:4-hydroxy-3-methylbut-2-enyl diphosphate reductase [Streptomyces sp. NBC_01669]|uniref:4-hydroxy-3-methylbut-2-enyl diphosphate reductase n=1 Tax=Streptomyces sp. NBC_01669 TaxID=2975909 RepID=UPI00225C0DBC|nr:4-hydroxy-3-methylbut-2-enyl diphosphate reductase [Streptomyces sp. NBC_01669]MCX4536931.1 4-hydroxy-3-methylbut-2-enyl diphosphate reductase [Streptomyces sp. NBC_01669]